jgi:hypothetical protein
MVMDLLPKTDAIYRFDPEFIDYLKTTTTAFWKMAWIYRSNWRVLHIDGFEGGRKLPAYTGTKRVFFNYEEAKV